MLVCVAVLYVCVINLLLLFRVSFACFVFVACFACLSCCVFVCFVCACCVCFCLCDLGLVLVCFVLSCLRCVFDYVCTCVDIELFCLASCFCLVCFRAV